MYNILSLLGIREIEELMSSDPTHWCPKCRERFTASKDGCPHCGSSEIMESIPFIIPGGNRQERK